MIRSEPIALAVPCCRVKGSMVPSRPKTDLRWYMTANQNPAERRTISATLLRRINQCEMSEPANMTLSRAAVLLPRMPD